MRIRGCVGAVILWLGLCGVHAQSYSIDWYKISGGGGTSTSGQYSVSGTAGQPDAGGPLVGGNTPLTGGFWALISLTQTPGVPTLNISQLGNTVTLYWPAVPGWNLLQNTSVANASGWTTNTSWTTSNGTNFLNAVNPTGDRFYRLQHP